MEGIILAGGQSRRFGKEKCAALLEGRPLIAWAHEVLTCCRTVAVSAHPRTEASRFARDHGLDVVCDEAGDPAGPLAGIRAGLRWAHSRGAILLASVPCDMPLLPGCLVPRLSRARGNALASVALTPEGLQPLCALWHVALLARLDVAMREQRHPAVHDFLNAIDAVEVDFTEVAHFKNINFRRDLDQVASGRLKYQ